MTRDGRVDDNADPELRWLEQGEGEPVILLHGLLSRMDHWETSLETLGRVCRVIAPSLPIYDARLRESSIEALARHIVRFLDALEIPRAVIGGHSLGGQVAIEVALTHPDRVSGLILADSSGLFERNFTPGMRRRPKVEGVRNMGKVFYDPALAYAGSVRAIEATPDFAVRALRFARAARRHRVEDRLREIKAATLLVWGRDDLITPPEMAERFRALIPDAELWFLSLCGHAPMLERPEAFNHIVAAWLEATRARREGYERVAGGAR